MHYIGMDCHISTLDFAVVNETGGTANRAFEQTNFAEQDVKVYGKTGSTQNPEHAWFAGFAEDSRGRSISIAIVVEEASVAQQMLPPWAGKSSSFASTKGIQEKRRLK